MDGSPVAKRRMGPTSGVRFPDVLYITAMIFNLPQSFQAGELECRPAMFKLVRHSVISSGLQ